MSMKRSLFCIGLMGMAGFGLLTAAAGGNWCHFAPGNWTGDRATSKASLVTLTVDSNGYPIPGAHAAHVGDGPVIALGPSCTGAANPPTNCRTAPVYDGWGNPIQVDLAVNGAWQCVCPAGTPNAGAPPQGSGATLNCGIHG